MSTNKAGTAPPGKGHKKSKVHVTRISDIAAQIGDHGQKFSLSKQLPENCDYNKFFPVVRNFERITRIGDRERARWLHTHAYGHAFAIQNDEQAREEFCECSLWEMAPFSGAGPKSGKKFNTCLWMAKAFTARKSSASAQRVSKMSTVLRGMLDEGVLPENAYDYLSQPGGIEELYKAFRRPQQNRQNKSVHEARASQDKNGKRESDTTEVSPRLRITEFGEALLQEAVNMERGGEAIVMLRRLDINGPARFKLYKSKRKAQAKA